VDSVEVKWKEMDWNVMAWNGRNGMALLGRDGM
jgi:hypothetical protein